MYISKYHMHIHMIQCPVVPLPLYVGHFESISLHGLHRLHGGADARAATRPGLRDYRDAHLELTERGCEIRTNPDPGEDFT